jgi:glycosyltransferase involved in cell wall biosynthesis
LLKKTAKIVLDTQSHAEYSSSLMELPIEKYHSIPVGTDEGIFKFQANSRKDNDKFQVLYYGNMLPLHGIDFVIESAISLRAQKGIEFLLIGGGKQLQQSIDMAISKGANIKYQKWVPYQELPQVIAAADICLGGPFGGTTQSQYVVTGKTIQFLRMGKPVIIGRNKESDVFIDRVNALVVDQASSLSLEEAITWACKNKESILKIGTNGMELYRNCFSNKVVSKSIAQLLDSLFKTK